eukprot:753805-Amphidinium_carterae.1
MGKQSNHSRHIFTSLQGTLVRQCDIAIPSSACLLLHRLTSVCLDLYCKLSLLLLLPAMVTRASLHG